MENVIGKLKTQVDTKSCEKGKSRKSKNKGLYGTKINKNKQTSYNYFIKRA